MIINIENTQSDLNLSLPAIERLISFCLKHLEFRGTEISFKFLDHDAICELHGAHFDDPSFTDCMTFPIDPESDGEDVHLGECVIAPKAAVVYAQTNKSDPYRELTLYIVHTLLHLKGYDDIEEEECEEMRAAEAQVMDAIEKEGLLLSK